jgi:hypothetical protein
MSEAARQAYQKVVEQAHEQFSETVRLAMLSLLHSGCSWSMFPPWSGRVADCVRACMTALPHGADIRVCNMETSYDDI